MTWGPFLSALGAHHQQADMLKMEMENMLTLHCFFLLIIFTQKVYLQFCTLVSSIKSIHYK